MNKKTLKAMLEALNILWNIYDSKPYMSEEERQEFMKIVELQNRIEKELGWRK